MPKPDISMFGSHEGITCDGCCAIPIVGFRYQCTKCTSPQGVKCHDICETCYDAFMHGNFLQNNKENKYVTLGASNDVKNNFKNHMFKAMVDKTCFTPMNNTGRENTTKVGQQKTKPNAICPCGSKKKYKKCCGDATIVSAAE